METFYLFDLKKFSVKVTVIATIIGIVAAPLTGWVTINKDIQKNSVRIDTLEKQGGKTEQKVDKLDDKVDRGFERVMDKLEAIQKEVSNKADRK